ncbi:MAG: alpha/beta hydrolase [Myxococcota bacterium]|nr:alpha/beta hydrolase [Myxococcota bacterium]
MRTPHGTDPGHPGSEIRRDLPYHKDDPHRVLDLHRPQADGPLPAVILVHGGSWARGNRSRMERVADKAVERGYAALNIEYRLAPEHRYPAQLIDVLDAVCWVRANSEALDIDPDRIALWGYSAGGHLSLLAAARPDLAAADSRCADVPATVQACVAGAGPSDLRLLGGARPVQAFLGGSPEEIPLIYEEASPLVAADSDFPPTFLYHGRDDWIVNVEHSRRMRDALGAAGVSVELFETGGGHISGARFEVEPLDRAFDFLDRSLPKTSPPALAAEATEVE